MLTTRPLISCLMITGKRPALPLRAISCYVGQTYSCKELVIVDDGDDRLQAMLATTGRTDIVHIRVPKTEHTTLGDLRNIALEAATGEYVAQWDDDDWYARQRLQWQYDALQGADACFLRRLIMAWPERGLFGISHQRMWEGSMVAKKSVLTNYPSLRQGEDTAIVRALKESHARIRLLDRPGLYVYVCHGDNASPQPHFERLFQHRDFQPLSSVAVSQVTERLNRRRE